MSIINELLAIKESKNDIVLPASESSPLICSNLPEKTFIQNVEEISPEAFDFEGYQVVRSEFFAHTFEPALSFNRNRIYVNQACIRRFPDVEYVQVLVNQESKKLVIRPASEDSQDAFRWRSTKLKPRQLNCPIFSAKITSLMSWNSEYRYKLLGKIIHCSDERLLIFDLNATEKYACQYKEGSRPRYSRTPIFPAEWENQFGLSVEEHVKQLQVNTFDGYTVFQIKNRKDPQKSMEQIISEDKVPGEILYEDN